MWLVTARGQATFCQNGNWVVHMMMTPNTHQRLMLTDFKDSGLRQQRTSAASRGFVECRILRSAQSIFFFFFFSLCLVYKSAMPTRAVPGNLPLQILGAPPSAEPKQQCKCPEHAIRLGAETQWARTVCPFIAPKSETRYVRASGGRG